MNDKGTLEIGYKIEGINVYKEGEQKWDNLGLFFTFKIKDKTGELSILAKDTNIDVGEIKNKKNELEIASKNFLLCLKFLSSELNLVQTNKYLKFYSDNDLHYEISCDSDIERIVKILKGEHVENSFTGSLCCLFAEGELNVPQVDLPEFSSFDIAFSDNLRRNLFTFIQTAALRELSENYPDDMLKRWFITLEYYKKFEQEEIEDYDDMKYTRDFASHPVCKNPKLVEFIKDSGLHSAICTEKKVAHFDRQNTEHINFVRKYEKLAEERVRNLLNKKLNETCC